MDTKTYTADQIRQAVIDFDEGCYEGKVRFLAESFGIEANPNRTVAVTVNITLPTFGEDGEEIDTCDIDSAVERVLDSYLADEIGAEGGTIDART
jgi:hypothetical protein